MEYGGLREGKKGMRMQRKKQNDGEGDRKHDGKRRGKEEKAGRLVTGVIGKLLLRKEKRERKGSVCFRIKVKVCVRASR